ncbi:MAG: hypothetical protein JWM80_871 [Cyanobacteria bacterium RYN_339]|nr:hypothetical protein [Cyanobacteria bacterium RYN_339]
MIGKFAAFLRRQHLRALAEENVRALHTLQPPIMVHFAAGSHEELVLRTEVGLDAKLAAWELGEALEYELGRVKAWEAGQLPDLPPDDVQVTDFVLMFMAQKQAMKSFLAKFTNSEAEQQGLARTLDEHYAQARSEATEAVIRRRVARQHGEKSR